MVSIIISILIQISLLMNGNATTNQNNGKDKPKPTQGTPSGLSETYGGTGTWNSPSTPAQETPAP